MKRQAFIKALSILPMALLQACEKSFPDTPTIVTGKVIDENNMPVEGVTFSFSGAEVKGISPIPTFRIQGATNKEGIYSLSQVIPNDTSFSNFSPISYKKSFFFSGREEYTILILRTGTYEEVIEPIPVQREEYGGTVTFNFQIRKR
jgi:hypothetical protein